MAAPWGSAAFGEEAFSHPIEVAADAPAGTPLAQTMFQHTALREELRIVEAILGQSRTNLHVVLQHAAVYMQAQAQGKAQEAEAQWMYSSCGTILGGHQEALRRAEGAQGALLGGQREWSEACRSKFLPMARLDDVLTRLHTHFDAMAGIYLELREQMLALEGALGSVLQQAELAMMYAHVAALSSRLFGQLLRASFVVIEQPPDVVKTTIKFGASVRLLVGGKLSLSTLPEVTAAIVNGQQASQLLQVIAGEDPGPMEPCAGPLSSGGRQLSYNQDTPGARSLEAKFRDLVLKRIKRRGHAKKEETVTEEKFCVAFTGMIVLPGPGGESRIPLCALSHPVVVTVHGNQQTNALATVFWDNSFGAPIDARMPWEVPGEVPWHVAGPALSCFFTRMNGGAPFTPESLEYLFEKAVHAPVGTPLSWMSFARDAMPNRTFTFWEWFLSTAQLVQDHFAKEWAMGLIAGFVSKERTQQVLSQAPAGTFVLRFSDSKRGGISVSWTTGPPLVPGAENVFHLAPWFDKDLEKRPMSDMLRDLPQLQFLYPTLASKDEAFGPFYSQPKPGADAKNDGSGYVGHSLREVVVMPTDATPSGYVRTMAEAPPMVEMKPFGFQSTTCAVADAASLSASAGVFAVPAAPAGLFSGGSGFGTVPMMAMSDESLERVFGGATQIPMGAPASHLPTPSGGQGLSAFIDSLINEDMTPG